VGAVAPEEKGMSAYCYFSNPRVVREQEFGKTGLMEINEPSFPINELPSFVLIFPVLFI
jgi:hypothetical protein